MKYQVPGETKEDVHRYLFDNMLQEILNLNENGSLTYTTANGDLVMLVNFFYGYSCFNISKSSSDVIWDPTDDERCSLSFVECGDMEYSWDLPKALDASKVDYTTFKRFLNIMTHLLGEYGHKFIVMKKLNHSAEIIFGN